MTLYPYRGTLPDIDPDAWIAPSASVIGDTRVGPSSSIWYGAVLRGDVMPIRVGARTSIQDNSVVHTTEGWSACTVGDDCTVGHAVILHGCTVGHRVLVGMGSILLDGAEIGDDVILGAGSLVTARTKIPAGVMAFGRPAKPVRDLSAEELAQIREAAAHYVALLAHYRG
ncbi:MAG: gamma carbonic anhydrase family protein [Sandaracinaceae bacterium]|nr:gamma carbonic anhydrase family protein [Sandaracinaceae bacterium]